MAAKIDIQIPQQNFEIIRNRIGEIITEELAFQDETKDDVTVWCERIVPFNVDELPVVNVSYANTDFQAENVNSADGRSEFYVDVFTQSKDKTAGAGDKLASLRASRIAGIIRYVLSSSQYIYLGFTPGTILNRRVSGIAMGRNSESDALNTMGARITFSVRAEEVTATLEPLDTPGFDTQVKLEDTEKGYKYQVDNS